MGAVHTALPLASFSANICFNVLFFFIGAALLPAVEWAALDLALEAFSESETSQSSCGSERASEEEGEGGRGEGGRG